MTYPPSRRRAASVLLRFTTMACAWLVAPPMAIGDDEAVHDVVIYGATSGGVTAAVQARRMGRSAIVINPDRHVGGMTSSGLGHTDWGRREVIGGVSLEFYRRVHGYYRDDSRWVREPRSAYVGQRHLRANDDSQWGFEPHAAERVFRDWLEEYEVPLIDGRLDRADGRGVTKDGLRITALTMEDGTVYQGRTFIDATYEGDLMAAAGVSYIVGRESNETYGETLNGIQTQQTAFHVFTVPGQVRDPPRPLPQEARVDPHVVRGDPSSGLLPGVNPAVGTTACNPTATACASPMTPKTWCRSRNQRDTTRPPTNCCSACSKRARSAFPGCRHACRTARRTPTTAGRCR